MVVNSTLLCVKDKLRVNHGDPNISLLSSDDTHPYSHKRESLG